MIWNRFLCLSWGGTWVNYILDKNFNPNSELIYNQEIFLYLSALLTGINN